MYLHANSNNENKKGENCVKILSKTGTKMFFALMLIAGLIFQFCYILLPQDVYAQETTLIITGDGVKNQKNYTLEKLKSMPQTRAIFSTVNTYPTKNWHVGEGVTLKDLLKEAGIKDDAKKIKFYASDGFYQEFTIKEILEDTRYYFPGLKENDEYDGRLPGSDRDPEKVETLVALMSAEDDKYEGMSGDRGIRLLMGQRAVTEQNNPWYIKKLNKIEVSREEPGKWDAPIADLQPGKVEPGTKIILSCPNKMELEEAKIYYTTDGSEPDLNSDIFNIIAPRWERDGRSNQPIEINKTTTIKAVIIGPGKHNSDVVELKYEVGSYSGAVLTWTDDPMKSQAITWLLPNTVSRAKIQYMIAKDFKGNFNGAQFQEIEGEKFGQNYNRFTVQLTQLTPDTEYVYRVENEDGRGEPCYFKTAAQTDKFSFIYLGDSQQERDISLGYDHLEEILRSAYDGSQSFVLFGGDLTDNGSDENEWSEFINSISEVSSQIPIMPTMGNHDGSCYLNFFNLPTNGPEGLGKRFYSFDYGDAHFVILDSNNNALPEAKEWLQNDLKNTSKKWKFAVFHHPAYPNYIDYKTEMQAKSIRKNWVPILEQNGVDMVFGGHQHMYMRTHPIKDGKIYEKPEDGIIYIMGNASPKAYQDYHDLDYIAKIESGSNYQIIEIDNDTLTFTSVSADGKLLDTYLIANASSDIEGHWAQSIIRQMIDRGIIKGYPDGSFGPNNNITRAEFTSLLVRAFNLEPGPGKIFSDTANHWAKEAIKTANYHGLVGGYSDTLFGPDDPITREQIAVMVVNAIKTEQSDENKPFTDSAQISAWAKESVTKATTAGLITGYPDGSFRPKDNATRAEAVVVLDRSM